MSGVTAEWLLVAGYWNMGVDEAVYYRISRPG